jgi:hypothetical protein
LVVALLACSGSINVLAEGLRASGANVQLGRARETRTWSGSLTWDWQQHWQWHGITAGGY